MPSYLIKKDEKTNKIIYMEYELHGYTFNPKKSKNAYLDVQKVMIVNNKMIDGVLTIKFNKAFKKIAAMTLEFLDDEDSSNGANVLGEIERLRNIILNKYQDFLSKEKADKFLLKLRYLENQIRASYVMRAYNMDDSFNNYIDDEEKSHGSK